MKKKNAKASRPRMNAVERDLIGGLEEFRGALKGEAALGKRFTIRQIVLELAPQTYTPDLVRQTRGILNASQALFAQFLGVSPKTVRAWEAGKEPSEMACRFMDEIRRDPAYWLKRWRQATRSKESC